MHPKAGNYYNEFDPKAAEWLRELIKAKLIPQGTVDERSICDIEPSDLSEFTQCHFFAGIGGWSLALQLAGCPADRPVWTGSCPCQSYSVAGKRKGNDDARNLWPVFFNLIRECKPHMVFGEQVENAIRHGWLDGISADLEGEGYACGHAVLGAHSAGAPHIRQRLYWVADRQCEGLEGRIRGWSHPGREDQHGHLGCGSTTLRVADAETWGRQDGPQIAGSQGPLAGETECWIGVSDSGQLDGVAITSDDGTWRNAGKTGGLRGEPVDARTASIRQAHGPTGTSGADSRSASGVERLGDTASGGCGECRDASQPGSCGHAVSPGWSGFEIVHCRDGKARRFERQPQQMADGIPTLLDALRDAGASEVEIQAALETFPLSQGVQGRVSLLRGYGNAIVPETAAQFILAFTNTRHP